MGDIFIMIFKMVGLIDIFIDFVGSYYWWLCIVEMFVLE